MKGKGERGNWDRGLWGKRKGGRGFLAKWPSSSSLSNQNREGERGGRGGGRPGGGGAGGPAQGGGREVAQNGEEAEGNRFRSLPRVGVLRRGGSMAAGGGRLWWSVVAVLGGSGGREAWLGWAWRGGEPIWPFYRRGKAIRARIFELQELRWPSMAVRRNISA
jgi:hypothetical protein